MSVKPILATVAIFISGFVYAGDGTTKPAVQTRLDTESYAEDCDCDCGSRNEASATTAIEVEQPANVSYQSERMSENADDSDTSIDSNVDTGTKPAVRARLNLER